MLTIYVSPHKQTIITVDGKHMTVREMYVFEAENVRSLQDCERLPDLAEVEIVVSTRISSKKLKIGVDTTKAIIVFLQTFHAQQNISFDCYSFVNLVKSVEEHKVHRMLEFWRIRPKPQRLSVGSVVFFLSGKSHFHHAAIYIGARLYISVYGAGGDLEISSLMDMKRDFGAERVKLAKPTDT